MDRVVELVQATDTLLKATIHKDYPVPGEVSQGSPVVDVDLLSNLLKRSELHTMSVKSYAPARIRCAFRNHFLVEVPPARRVINFITKEDDANFFIHIPWTYFLVSRNSGKGVVPADFRVSRAWMSDKQVTSEDDRLRPLCLPNIESNGKVCFGSSSPLEQGPNGAINAFWSSSFNVDITVNLFSEWFSNQFDTDEDEPISHLFNAFADWEELTMNDGAEEFFSTMFEGNINSVRALGDTSTTVGKIISSLFTAPHLHTGYSSEGIASLFCRMVTSAVLSSVQH